tara:strand:+ start:235 stop:438 length:204 start_codon:yes stop_codon:yes gene_type:complete
MVVLEAAAVAAQEAAELQVLEELEEQLLAVQEQHLELTKVVQAQLIQAVAAVEQVGHLMEVEQEVLE